MNYNHLMRTLKSSLLIRYAVWPLMALKKRKQYRDYHLSGEDKNIRTLKDIYEGKRCFIIGNGHSLRLDDLEKIKNEISFGSNRIYGIFNRTDWRPTYYLAEDEDGYAELVPNILGHNIRNYIFSCAAKKYENDIIDKKNIYHGLWTNKRYVANRYNDTSSHISEDISDHISDGYTVTFSAIQIAIYMGIKKIYLLGVDFNYSYIADRKGKLHKVENVKTYFDGKERAGSYLNYYSTLFAYQKAEEYAKNHGIKIYNATRGGALEVFPRICVDDIF